MLGHARGYDTAAVFPMSRVQHVDARNQLLTFRTQDGEMKTMRVAYSMAVKRDSFSKGDIVTIEVDLDDQIVKIIKTEEAALLNKRHSRSR
jgi:hypothetical protein